jgi:hypothetical protein
MQQEEINREHLDIIKAGIKNISDFNVFSVRDIVLHFQALLSAHASRMLMEAPGLYYRDLSFYVVSKSGMNRGHASMNENIQPLLPEGKRICYGFVLYPESFVRTCMDIILRKTTKNITRDLRISMENVFNRKQHKKMKLTDSEIEEELIRMLKRDLGRKN